MRLARPPRLAEARLAVAIGTHVESLTSEHKVLSPIAPVSKGFLHPLPTNTVQAPASPCSVKPRVFCFQVSCPMQTHSRCAQYRAFSVCCHTSLSSSPLPSPELKSSISVNLTAMLTLAVLSDHSWTLQEEAASPYQRLDFFFFFNVMELTCTIKKLICTNFPQL